MVNIKLDAVITIFNTVKAHQPKVCTEKIEAILQKLHRCIIYLMIFNSYLPCKLHRSKFWLSLSKNLNIFLGATLFFIYIQQNLLYQ